MRAHCLFWSFVLWLPVFANCSGRAEMSGGGLFECGSGLHSGGDRSCVALGSCADGFHDGGDGSCVPVGTCLSGYVSNADGVCLPDCDTDTLNRCSEIGDCEIADGGEPFCVCPEGYEAPDCGACVVGYVEEESLCVSDSISGDPDDGAPIVCAEDTFRATDGTCKPCAEADEDTLGADVCTVVDPGPSWIFTQRIHLPEVSGGSAHAGTRHNHDGGSGASVASSTSRCTLLGGFGSNGVGRGGTILSTCLEDNGIWALDEVDGDSVIGETRGVSAAVSGGRGVIGAPALPSPGGGPALPGAVYHIDIDAPAGTAESRSHSTANDAASGEALEFGRAVALEGSTMLVGAPGRSQMGGAFNQVELKRAGVVYFFERDSVGWSPVKVFEETGTPNGLNLGWSVALSGDWAFVAKPFGNHRTLRLFFRNSSGAWEKHAQQLPSPSNYGEFGRVMAVKGKILAVGTALLRGYGIAVFEIDPDAPPEDWKYVMLNLPQVVGRPFSLAMSNDQILVGLPDYDKNKDDIHEGAVQSWTKDTNGTWIAGPLLTETDAMEGRKIDSEHFGQSVAMMGNDRAIVLAGPDDEGLRVHYLHRTVE